MIDYVDRDGGGGWSRRRDPDRVVLARGLRSQLFALMALEPSIYRLAAALVEGVVRRASIR